MDSGEVIRVKKKGPVKGPSVRETMVSTARLELATWNLVGTCSVHLSYADHH